MGQYHLIVNLDRQEFLDPHKLGVGLKAWEQIANHPSTPQALFVLLLCSNGRGGGDLSDGAEPYIEKVIGRWAGDRIAVIGDYAEDRDLVGDTPDPASAIYQLCQAGIYRDLSTLVRPVLAAELGVVYVAEPWTLKMLDGPTTCHESWFIHHDPNAAFSILEPPQKKAPRPRKKNRAARASLKSTHPSKSSSA